MDLSYPNNFFVRIFQIPPEETTFSRRGFNVTHNSTVKHLENIGEKFLLGYHYALSAKSVSALAEKLNLIEPFYQGFAYEGAAMGLALLDNLLFFRKKLLPELLEGPGKAHIYTAHIGIGWAFARLPWFRYRVLPSISKFDPLFRWLIVDGYGFHEGYFYPQKYFHSKINLNRLRGYAQNAFAQGLGRSLWFVKGANAAEISQTITKLPNHLRGDLWSGVGLACTYAGGVGEAEIEKLKIRAGVYLPHLAQGAAFAAKTRQRAGNPSEQTEIACRIFCCCTSAKAASITDEKLERLPADSEIPLYEVWRRNIQKEFSLVEV